MYLTQFTNPLLTALHDANLPSTGYALYKPRTRYIRTRTKGIRSARRTWDWTGSTLVVPGFDVGRGIRIEVEGGMEIARVGGHSFDRLLGKARLMLKSRKGYRDHGDMIYPDLLKTLQKKKKKN